MALHFIPTEIVLASEDGMGFDSEIKLESEDVNRARIAAENSSKKPLFMQLQEQKDKKQEEYDRNTKLIFAPPPGLEGDDLEYFNDLEERKSKVKDIRAVNEGKAVDAFRMAQKKKDYASLKPKASLENPIGISKSIFTQNKDIPDNLPVFKRKSINETNKLISKKTKVIENSDNNNMKNDNIDTNIHNNIHNDSESKFIIPTESKPESKVLSGMFDYNSDSD